MGFDNEHAVRLVFDIETCPLDDAAAYIEPAEAPGNYKDPAKIAAYIEQANAEQLQKCGLDVDLCRIVALGWQSERDETPFVMHGGHGISEQMLLKSFWNLASVLHLVGFNCLGFDLPVLLRRSLYLGVPVPRIQIDRFKHPQVTDLMDELSFNGKLKFRGLSFYCKRFGIDIVDELTGADMAQAVKDERWDDIEAHVKADVRKTAALASRLGYFHAVETAATF
jgi:hypothetical protein